MTTTTTKTVRVVKLYSMIYRVQSKTKQDKFYTVIVKDGAPTSCNCGGFTYQQKVICKHMYDVMMAIDGSIPMIDATQTPEKLTTVRKTVRLQYEDDEYEF